MVNRVTAICLVVGAIAGYALAGPSVGAQSGGNVLPTAFSPGDKVTLYFEYGAIAQYTSQVSCTVVEAQTSWVKCATDDAFGRPAGHDWYGLRRVYRITKQEK